MRKHGYTDKDYWEKYWDKEERDIQFYFDKLLDQYISWKDVSSYMEVGGAPGSIMAFMSKEHGLSVSTVDFTEKARISEFLKSHGVKDFNVFQDDFLTFNIDSHCKKYDIVASWGFVEHFKKKTTARFIEKQKDMVSEDGYLIVELPNIRRAFWLVYWIFNRKVIKIHNLAVMDLPWLKQCVNGGGKFDLLYASYYFTMNSRNEFFERHKFLGKVCEKLVRFFQDRNFNDNMKKWFFPYIVIIAKRRREGQGRY